MGRALMILGTSSGAGKSLLTMALCRIFSNLGYDVVPFKSQNMSLNSAPSIEEEIEGFARLVEKNLDVGRVLGELGI